MNQTPMALTLMSGVPCRRVPHWWCKSGRSLSGMDLTRERWLVLWWALAEQAWLTWIHVTGEYTDRYIIMVPWQPTSWVPRAREHHNSCCQVDKHCPPKYVPVSYNGTKETITASYWWKWSNNDLSTFLEPNPFILNYCRLLHRSY